LSKGPSGSSKSGAAEREGKIGGGGAPLAGFIGNALGWSMQGQAGGFIAATLGAILILFIYRLLMRRR
jgi:uncharacterized membrane protein YeaQ/YmgE (transglycosylase-associated protein family)